MLKTTKRTKTRIAVNSGTYTENPPNNNTICTEKLLVNEEKSNLQIGTHVFVKPKSTLTKSIIHDTEFYNIKLVQIFTSNPRNGLPLKIDYDSLKTVDVEIVVHSPYLVNAIWKETESSMSIFKRDVELASKVSKYYVVHLPKLVSAYMPDIISTIKKLAKICDSYEVTLCIEHIASTDFTLVSHWNSFCDLLYADDISVKLVIDTAHLWANGIDIRDTSAVSRFFKHFTHIDKVAILHFNGNLHEISSHRDEHELIASKSDNIWGGKNMSDGYTVFVKYAKKYNWKVILEINADDSCDAVSSTLNMLRKS